MLTMRSQFVEWQRTWQYEHRYYVALGSHLQCTILDRCDPRYLGDCPSPNLMQPADSSPGRIHLATDVRSRNMRKAITIVASIVAVLTVTTVVTAATGPGDQGRRLAGPFCVGKFNLAPVWVSGKRISRAGVVRSISVSEKCQDTEIRKFGVAIPCPTLTSADPSTCLPSSNPVAGAPGANGSNGTNGSDGASGKDGKDGAKGEQGIPGVAGSVTVEQLEDGCVKFTGSDESTATLCPVKGDKGDTGLTGAKGDTGAAGAPGTAGANGDTGAPGAAGSTGATGATGAAGPAGPAGRDGKDGKDGICKCKDDKCGKDDKDDHPNSGGGNGSEDTDGDGEDDDPGNSEDHNNGKD